MSVSFSTSRPVAEIMQEWQQACQSEQPNKSLLGNTEWWFKHKQDHKDWAGWVTPNLRAQLLHFANIGSVAEVQNLEQFYVELSPQELMGLYRLFASHVECGKSHEMPENGAVAKALANNLLTYLESHFVAEAPAIAYDEGDANNQWQRALDSNIANKELLHHVNYWFRNHEMGGIWWSWVTPNLRTLLLAIASVADANNVGHLEHIYTSLSPKELVDLHHILLSYHLDGKKELMLQNGRVAKALVTGLEDYMFSLSVNNQTAAIQVVVGLLKKEPKKEINKLISEMADVISEYRESGYVSHTAPIGMRNGASNCWMISVLQAVMRMPSLRASIMNKEGNFAAGHYDALRKFIDEYQEARADNNFIYRRDLMQSMRNMFHAIEGELRASFEDQEDAGMGLGALVRELIDGRGNAATSCTLAHPLQESFYRDGGVVGYRNRYESMLFLNLTYNLNGSFNDLLGGNFFEQIFDEATMQVRNFTKKYVDTAPRELLMQTNRFSYRQAANGGYENYKIMNPIAIPLEFAFPSAYVTTGQGARYACDFFITHAGNSVDSGHYVTYVRDNGAWLHCDDLNISRVSDEQASNALSTSYVIHFTQI